MLVVNGLKVPSLDQHEYEKLILAWLRSKKGEVVRVTDIAKRYKVGNSSILTMLNELVAAGKVRRTNAKRSIGFYIPTEAMLNAERLVAQETPKRPPLKIDRQRQELYARLDNERNSIRSIG